jgi:hypothetical protein
VTRRLTVVEALEQCEERLHAAEIELQCALDRISDIAEENDDQPWRVLQRWLTEDREVRSLSVTVVANDPDWPADVDDPTDDDAVWSWTYQIEASDWWLYGDEEDGEPSGSSVTYHGSGRSLDAAAARVLKSMDDHEQFALAHAQPPTRTFAVAPFTPPPPPKETLP